MQTRERIHRLIDELPEDELPAAERVLIRLRDIDDPVLHALRNAAEDDEPLSPEDEAAIDEGLQALQHGDFVRNADLPPRVQ